WAVVAEVHGPGHRGERPVRLTDLHGDRARAHRAAQAVVQVGRGLTGDELQRVERDAAARGHGVRPGHGPIEADRDAGIAERVDSVDVEAARYGEVLLPEARSAPPEPVRICEEHAAAGR